PGAVPWTGWGRYGALEEPDAEAARALKRRRRVNCLPLLLALLLPWAAFVFCFATAGFFVHYAAPFSSTMCEVLVLAARPPQSKPSRMPNLSLYRAKFVRIRRESNALSDSGFLLLACVAGQGLPAPPTEEQAKEFLEELKNRSNNSDARTETSSEMLDRVLGLVLEDASVVRLKSEQANKSEDCTWPSCAAYCVPCAKTNKYWTCLSSATQCQENSECVVGNCYAHAGYCYADAYPQHARCFMGAKAPRVDFHNTLILRLGAVGPVPLPKARAEDWFEWARGCCLVPLVLFGVGIFVAYKTCWVLDFSRGDQCEWLPATRKGIIVFSAVCLLFFCVLQVIRFKQTRRDIHAIEERFNRLQQSMRHFQDLTNELVEAERTYNQSLYFAPDSCSNNPLVTSLVQMLAQALMDEFAEVDVILQAIRDTLDTMMVLLARGKRAVHDYGVMVIYYPILPAFVMLLTMVVLLCINCYIWDRPKLLNDPWMRGVVKSLAPVMVIFILFSALSAAVVFYVALLISGVCLNIDENLEVAARRMHFRDVVPERINIDGVLQHTAKYYLRGTNVNPMATLLQNFEAALYTVLHFYMMFDWLVQAGAASCPGLNQLSPAPLIESLLETTQGAYDFVSAKNIWPYYHSIIHETTCRHFPRNGMGLVFICVLIGFFFCPAIAITISNHLKHMGFHLRKAHSLKDNIDTEAVGAIGVTVESKLDLLNPDEQALLLDDVFCGRSEEVIAKYRELSAQPRASSKIELPPVESESCLHRAPWAWKSWKRGPSEGFYPVYITAATLLAAVAGWVLGDFTFYSFMEPSYAAQLMVSYTEVDPSSTRLADGQVVPTSGGRFQDAGQVYFNHDTVLDVNRSFSFKLADVYCVAPIRNKNCGEPCGEDFWAVGKNCCSENGTHFECGDVGSKHAKSGLRLMDNTDVPFYRLAVVQAAGKHKMVSQHPIFFHWLEDPVAELRGWQRKGFRRFAIAMAAAFAISAAALAAALHTMHIAL
ncbi:unnamed protein product, partial [Effrenium voratum]